MLLPRQMISKAEQCIVHKCRAMLENYISSRQSVMSQANVKSVCQAIGRESTWVDVIIHKADE